MASEIVATNPETYGADPVHGNYTNDAHTHLWCAQALSSVVATPDMAFEEFNDDIQDALRYLLSCEVKRAMQAQKAKAQP